MLGWSCAPEGTFEAASAYGLGRRRPVCKGCTPIIIGKLSVGIIMYVYVCPARNSSWGRGQNTVMLGQGKIMTMVPRKEGGSPRGGLTAEPGR